MKRRSIISAFAGFGAATAFGTTRAQQAGKVWRMGVLSQATPAEFMRPILAKRMAALGYVEGRDLVIDVRYAQSKPELLPGLAEELVATKPDVLLGLLNREIIALRHATTTIPIVMMYALLPVEIGLISSLARPGGNITGTASFVPETAGKILQLVRETAPHVSRLAAFDDPDFPSREIFLQHGDQAAKVLGLRVTRLLIRTDSDFDAALASLARDRPDAMTVAVVGSLTKHIPRVIEFAARHRIPAMYAIPSAVRLGGLMSYAPDLDAIALRHMSMVDKIFKGAKPSDIPVEEPTHFQFVINMKTAKAMGLVIPPTVLLQATELIE